MYIGSLKSTDVLYYIVYEISYGGHVIAKMSAVSVVVYCIYWVVYCIYWVVKYAL